MPITVAIAIYQVKKNVGCYNIVNFVEIGGGDG